MAKGVARIRARGITCEIGQDSDRNRFATRNPHDGAERKPPQEPKRESSSSLTFVDLPVGRSVSVMLIRLPSSLGAAWQIDVMGGVRLSGTQLSVVTGVDDHSRFCVIARLVERADRLAPRVITEILNVDNVPLVDLATANDFVISEAIGSQLIAQLAEMPERRNVFLQLYDPDGPSLHLIPVQVIGLVGPIQAAEMYRAAYRAGVLAIGYRSAHSGLDLNPHPTQTIDLQEGDQLVVTG